MKVLRHVRVAVVALGATGCIAFVTPIDAGDHCTIAGQTACATCIRTSCQAPVDACCGAKGCGLGLTGGGLFGGIDEYGKSDVLEVLDRCGGGDASACASGLANERTGTEEKAVRACVTSSCVHECLGGDTGSTTWTCDLSRDGEGECGACFFAKCKVALDDCCADAYCAASSSVRELVGGCAVAEDPALCAYRYPKRDTSGFAGPVGKCMAESCATACFGDGTPHTECDLRSDGEYCVCTDAERSSGPACSKTGGWECARWVSDGCTCGRYGCAQTGTGCNCELGPSDEGARCAPGSSGRCCVYAAKGSAPRCKCDTSITACYADLGQYDIDDCDEATFLAKIENLRVESCSN